MKGKKKFTIGVLRAIGVCALVGILIGALAFLEKDHSVEPAQIIFAGTKDDADCAHFAKRRLLCGYRYRRGSGCGAYS